MCWLLCWKVSSKFELSLCGIVDLGPFDGTGVSALESCSSCVIGGVELNLERSLMHGECS